MTNNYIRIIGSSTDLTSTTSITTGTGSGFIVNGDLITASSATVETGPKNTVQFQHKKGVSPGVYFRFVKSKMTKIQVAKLKTRVAPLRHLLDGAHKCGQQGLVEELERQLVTVFRYQEAAAAGFDKLIPKRYIDDFIHKVVDRTVAFTLLKEFPRPIPAANQTRIQFAKKVGFFDEMWILFNSPKDEKKLKTTAQKIREKDPIVFGRFLCDPDNYVYITDWSDEFCDITLDKLVDVVGKDATFAVTPLTEADVKELRDTVTQRVKALQDTNRGNWQQKEKDQLELETLRKHFAKPMWKRVLSRLSRKN